MQRIAHTWHASVAVLPCQRSVEAHHPSQAERPRIKLFAPPSHSMPAPRPPSGLARNTRLLMLCPIPMCNRANRSPHVQPTHIPARVHKPNQQRACYFAQYAMQRIAHTWHTSGAALPLPMQRQGAPPAPGRAPAHEAVRAAIAQHARTARPSGLARNTRLLRPCPIPMCNGANRSPHVQPMHITVSA